MVACNADKPLKYRLTDDVTITSADSSQVTLLKGCEVEIYEEDNPLMYTLIKLDAIDDKETYMEVLIRLKEYNDSLEVKGSLSYNVLKNNKRLR